MSGWIIMMMMTVSISISMNCLDHDARVDPTQSLRLSQLTWQRMTSSRFSFHTTMTRDDISWTGSIVSFPATVQKKRQSVVVPVLSIASSRRRRRCRRRSDSQCTTIIIIIIMMLIVFVVMGCHQIGNVDGTPRVIFAAAAAAAAAMTNHENCPLTCHNGGTCVWNHAQKKNNQDNNNNKNKNDNNNKNNNTAPTPSTTTTTNTLPSCRCLRGYTGETCEIALRWCPTETNETIDRYAGLCYNGQHCMVALDDEGKSFTHCECDPYVSPLKSNVTIRRYCETIATVFCETPVSNIVHENGHPTTVPKSSTSHCTNGGKCKTSSSSSSTSTSSTTTVLAHLGCDCPLGYTGDYCEVPLSMLPSKSKHWTRTDIVRAVEATIAFTCIIILFGLIGFFVYHGITENNQQRRQRIRGGGYRGRKSRRRRNGGDDDPRFWNEQEMTTVTTTSPNVSDDENDASNNESDPDE
jgi:hypothetical protein